MPVVADVGVTRWRGVYGTYRVVPFTLRVAPPADDPVNEPCSEGAGEPGLGERSGWAS